MVPAVRKGRPDVREGNQPCARATNRAQEQPTVRKGRPDVRKGKPDVQKIKMRSAISVFIFCS